MHVHDFCLETVHMATYLLNPCILKVRINRSCHIQESLRCFRVMPFKFMLLSKLLI